MGHPLRYDDPWVAISPWRRKINYETFDCGFVIATPVLPRARSLKSIEASFAGGGGFRIHPELFREREIGLIPLLRRL